MKVKSACNKTTPSQQQSSDSSRTSLWGILHDEELTRVPDGIILRLEDEQEVLATGQGVLEAIGFGIEHSIRTRAVYAEGDLVAVWGYRPTSGMGSACFAWMLSCPAIDLHRVAAARATHKVVRELLEQYPAIIVSVDSRYEKSVRWLEWLGFEEFGRRAMNEAFLIDMVRRR